MNRISDSIEITCPICYNYKNNRLGEHIRNEHDEGGFHQAVLQAKKSGMPDPQIGEVFGLTFRQLEKIITDAYGINISVLNRPKKIKYWAPKDFKEETTTVWSYKQRGGWATHDGRYRGNWSPYLPRNVILKYSKPDDVILDYFVGGGTTAVEAKLLGRKCIARDINPACVELTLQNLNFKSATRLFNDGVYSMYEPEVSVGDARDLSNIKDDSIDLICAHPPYAGIINYSSKVDGDLSKLSVENFLIEMQKVAEESYRVLKSGKKCVILIGDTRKHKHVVPIGFWTIKVFLNAGFILKELVIKRQHNCKTTGFWSEWSVRYNFLLLAHEYLPIFEKPLRQPPKDDYSVYNNFRYKPKIQEVLKPPKENLETTTVWIFPKEKVEQEVKRNLIGRFAELNSRSVIVDWDEENGESEIIENNAFSIIYISPPPQINNDNQIVSYRDKIKEIVRNLSNNLLHNSYFVIDTRDFKINGLVQPVGLQILEDLTSFSELKIKEIVVVTPNNVEMPSIMSNENHCLEIIHRYLLIYQKKKEGD